MGTPPQGPSDSGLAGNASGKPSTDTSPKGSSASDLAANANGHGSNPIPPQGFSASSLTSGSLEKSMNVDNGKISFVTPFRITQVMSSQRRKSLIENVFSKSIFT